MRTLVQGGIGLIVAATAAAALAQDAAPSASMPIREVTVFKDGRSFVLREGEVPVDPSGDVVIGDLPRPLLGTFWPYAADPQATLAGVVAGRRRVTAERTALAVSDLLRANIGAEAAFHETGGERWSGKILGFPERSAAEVAAAPPGTAVPPGELMLAETAEGTRVVALAKIQDVTFKGPCRTSLRTEELRDALTLRLAWKGARAATAKVGMVYLQSGLRWIPGYRIDIDGAGRAKVRLQATLVNDLADLKDAAVHLVVGVPRFEFASTMDPMALAAEAADVWSRTAPSSRFRNDLGSNALQTQSVTWGDPDPGPAAAGQAELAEGVAGAAANEDLFVFEVKAVTLARGERMTLPVAEFEVPYTDVYVVDVPMTPPPEVWQAARGGQDLDRVREMLRPLALHKLRIEDASPFPITTAPAVVLRDGRLLGQGRTSYTAPRGRCDVTVTNAIGLRVRKDERETGRTPDSVRLRGDSYHRVDLTGTLSLANDADRPYEVEVVRHVLGGIDAADHGGAVIAVNLGEDVAAADAGARPEWWNWFGWPSWWSAVNGVGRITWKATVDPHSSLDLTYRWHYLWR